MSRIRVLMVIPNFRPSSGITTYAMNYYKIIDPDKVHMDFCVYWDGSENYEKEIKDTGATIFHLKAGKNIYNHYKCCDEILKNGNYHIIHDNTLSVSIPIMQTAKKRGVPVRILHSHNSRLGETKVKEMRNRMIVPVLKNFSTDFAACSEMAARALFGDSEYYLIPNIVFEQNLAFSKERREQTRRRMNAEGKIIIATVGRAVPQKNPLFALQVIKEVIKKHPDVEYWWIGQGTMLDTIKDEAEKIGIQNQIRLLGNREDVPDLYQAMDIFFLPSLFEGLPVTGVEAQAEGLPSVLSSSITRELTYTDLIEFVSLNDTIDQWVAAIERQISRIGERRSYIQELRKSPFSEYHAGDYLTEIYERLLKQHA